MSDEDYTLPGVRQVNQTDLTVTGGAGGTEADLADLGVLAARSGELAGDLAAISEAAHGILLDGDLLASAALNPTGFAQVETMLLGALDGPSGVSALAVRLAGRQVAISTVRAGYEAADEAQAQLMQTVQWLEGISGAQYLNLLLTGAAPALSAWPGAFTNPDQFGLYTDPERWLTAHPGVVDDLVNSLPGMLGYGPGTSYQDLVGKVADLFPDGTYALSEGVEDQAAEVTRPPAGIGDLMTALAYRDQRTDGQDPISVRRVEQPDGSVAFIVDIPGTRNDDLMPGQINPSTNDNGTNLHALAGDTTTRELAIAQALHDAGASATDPVMLVGHSQGGMVAAQAAADTADGTFGYNVTHVVTAASPIALADVPPDVQVLSLENANDIVPRLDGQPNPASPNITTVTYSNDRGTVGGNHALESGGYVDAGYALDGTFYDPSVQAFTDSGSAFFADPSGDTEVTTEVFTISRVPG